VIELNAEGNFDITGALLALLADRELRTTIPTGRRFSELVDNDRLIDGKVLFSTGVYPGRAGRVLYAAYLDEAPMLDIEKYADGRVPTASREEVLGIDTEAGRVVEREARNHTPNG
jgi:hypothetical protein